MFELVQVSNNSYYVNSPAKIGIYDCGDGSVYLIDSGNDKDAGRRLRKILDEHGWRLRAILVTHSNADHIGGCKYLASNTGCRVFAAGIEQCFTENPVLEPSFLYGGYPCGELRHKFLMAQDCKCEDISSPDFPKDIEVIPLRGHFFDMVGYRMPDGVCFMADCVSSAATLEKYQIGFIYDVRAYLDTLDHIETLSAPCFIPSHTEAVSEMKELAGLNRAKVHEIIGRILDICSEPKCFEAVLSELFCAYGLAMDFSQYVLVGSTVRSYLAYLREEGRLSVTFDGGYMLWQSI